MAGSVVCSQLTCVSLVSSEWGNCINRKRGVACALMRWQRTMAVATFMIHCFVTSHPLQAQNKSPSKDPALNLLKPILPKCDQYGAVPPDQVVADCSEWIKKGDLTKAQLVSLYVQRGRACCALKRFSQARDDFDHALKLDPTDVDAKWHHVLVSAMLSSKSDAISKCREMIATHPKHPNAYGLLTEILIAEGDIAEAVKVCNQGLAVDDTHPNLYLHRARIYLRQREFRRCLRDIARAHEINPFVFGPPETVYFMRGVAFAGLGLHQQALANLSMAFRVNPSSVQVIQELVKLHVDLHQAYFALPLAKEWTRLDDKNPASHVALSYVFNCLGRYKDAMGCATTALALKPESAEALHALGAAYDGLGKYADALKSYNRALARDPKHLNTLSNLSALLSSCPVDTFRDGKRARKLSIQLCEATNYQASPYVLVLAQAHAECGDFREAVRLAELSIKLAGSDNYSSEVARQMLKIFKQGKPFRHAPRANSPASTDKRAGDG